MYRVIESLAFEHDLRLVLLAALVCVGGSILSSQLLSRTFSAKSHQKVIKLLLSAMIGGATIWSTHFVAMLAYDPVFDNGYESVTTLLSLLVGIVGMAASISVAAFSSNSAFRVAGGGIFGLTVSAMHYVGMSAYLIPGRIVWDIQYLVASIGIGAALGAVSFYLIAAQRTRLKTYLAPVLMVLAICSMHFTGMAAITVELDPRIIVPPQLISDAALSFLVIGVTFALLLVGLASLLIESEMESEAGNMLRDAALRDPLTSLPNRMKLAQKLADVTEMLQSQPGARAAVLTIDLDLFKEVNDLHGHGAGDTVLRTLATRLESALGDGEFIARAGGDEFAAVKTQFRRVEEVQAFAQRLRAQIIEPISVEGAECLVGASVGISTSLEDGHDAEHLLHCSDMAMYRAKTGGDKKICFFNPEMDKQSRDRLMLVSDLRQAIDRGELYLAYQLQNDLVSLEANGFEVLLRWQHPDRGIVSPADFIPVAEETGLIREIGMWVLRTACFEAADWEKPFGIAVNVSPQQLIQPSFLEDVSDILFESGIDPSRLELEVTEASIIDDQKNTLMVMHRLKEMGIRIAMDDFGTGYSSLATLQAFPFDKIKIDRSFVQNVHKDAQRAAIVRSTLLLGGALKIPVLAEGVEAHEDLEFLQQENCTSVQGYYFGKPMSVEDARSIVGNKPRDADSKVA